jgi:tetratricopeptide (TPR) repeat protein
VERKATGRSQVRALVRQGQLEKAIESFETLIAGGEVGPYDYVYMGDLLIKAGRTESAVARYEDAVATYAHLGFHRNALALCRKILRLDGQHISANRQMGDLYAAEELYGDALYAYFAYLERADAGERDSETYRQVLRRVEELAPRRAEFAIRLSDLLVQLGRPDAAAAMLREALQQAARSGAVEVAAGLRERLAGIEPALAGAGMPAEEPAYEPVAEDTQASGTDDAVATAGETGAASEDEAGEPEVGKRHPEEAVNEFDLSEEAGLASGAPPEPTLLTLAPSAPPRADALSEALENGERDPQRYGEINLSPVGPSGGSDAEVEDGDFSTHYATGLERMRQGELEAALKSFAAAAWDDELQPEQARLLQEAQARCLAGLGRHREAIREFLLALQRPHKGAESAELTYLLALEYEALGELDEARKRLREALALRPDYAEAEARLSMLAEGAA